MGLRSWEAKGASCLVVLNDAILNIEFPKRNAATKISKYTTQRRPPEFLFLEILCNLSPIPQ